MGRVRVWLGVQDQIVMVSEFRVQGLGFRV